MSDPNKSTMDSAVVRQLFKDLAVLLALSGYLAADRPEPTPEELRALRAAARNADMLELGQLLFEAKSDKEREILQEEIRKRGL